MSTMNAAKEKISAFAHRNWRGVARFLLIFVVAQFLTHVIPHARTL